MLLRTYEPILFRSLEAANPAVRRHSALLFFEAFPLQDPDGPSRHTEEILQRQFDCLDRLLVDDDVSVRSVAVHGACRILGLYWELIPARAIRGLLERVIGDLAHDKR